LIKPVYSVIGRFETLLLKPVFSLFILSLIIVLSNDPAFAFDPYDPDPLSPGADYSSALEPDEISPPLLALKVLEKPCDVNTPEALEAAPAHTLDDPAPAATPVVPEITRGLTDRMNVSVTFDGGGYESGEEAEAILSTLRERSIKATIFLTGLFIRKYPAIVREMVRDGHEIGNHTLDHPRLTDFNLTLRQDTAEGVDRRFVSMELKGAAELFRITTGTEMAPLWRAPYGEINKDIRGWAFDAGYIHVGWTYDAKNRESLDTLDWVYDRRSRLYRTSLQIKERVLNFGKGSGGVNGGIILMHLGTLRKDDRASDVLGEMLDALLEKGYRFVKVSEQMRGGGLLQAAAKKRRPSAGGIVRLEAGAGQ
jgi:peptidoglycan/xylan/chitin deacetylase (PgdA/CDA1 family)